MKPRAKTGGTRLAGESFLVRLTLAFIGGIFVAAALAPFIVLLLVSLQTMDQVRLAQSLWPSPFVWSNYPRILAVGNWPRYIGNSLFVSLVATLVSLPVNAMTGYAFARIRFPFRRALFVLVLTGMMIPAQVTIGPLFSLIRRIPFGGGNNWLGSGGIGLINTRLALILPYAAGSFGVFLCRQFYRLFPEELDEAARLDGATRRRTFRSVYLPLSGPMLAALGILKFTGAWNDYAWPLVIVDTGADRITTVQLALTRFRNEGEIFWNDLSVATVVTIAVVLILFLSLQRYFVSGLLAGSVKE